MGNRLTKITTRTGDDGTTGLADGSRVDKDSARINAIGAVDELNCALGLLLTHALTPELHACLARVQHALFDLGGELATPGRATFDAAYAMWLEHRIEELNTALPPLQEFVLPGGGPAAAVCHVARTVCRRAERELLHLKRTEAVNRHAVVYLNRLSDLLFVVARTLARGGEGEIMWRPGYGRG